MKADLDRIMTDRGIDALLVSGGTFEHNPALYYLANGAHLGERTLVVKPRGAEPVLIVASMERDIAAKTGLPFRTLPEFGLDEIYKAANGDETLTAVKFRARVLRDLGIRGRVAVYGRVEAGEALAVYPRLADELAPDIEIMGEFGGTVLAEAMLTKDEDELARIREVGSSTLAIVDNIKDFLAGHPRDAEKLLRPDGQPLTVADVKARIARLTAELGLEDPNGPIFATGYDSAIPHSAGTAEAPIRLGETIVFDIFPREAGGGYYYDFTRTWCVGYAPDETLAIHETVANAFDLAMANLRPGTPCDQPQKAVIDFFKLHDHPFGHEAGYVHGLGHSVGLAVHEPPILSHLTGHQWSIQPGMVLTVEPGLYYPDKGIGVRIEDFVWLNPSTEQWDTIPYAYDQSLLIP